MSPGSSAASPDPRDACLTHRVLSVGTVQGCSRELRSTECRGRTSRRNAELDGSEVIGTPTRYKTSEQLRSNNAQTPGKNRASSGTRRRGQALRKPTLYGLQNLHPRFKSGRRLHIVLRDSRDRESACACGRFLLLRRTLEFALHSDERPL